jgi:hypothetical protein
MKKIILLTAICAICTQANSQWSLTGNFGTSASTNFVGTTDNVALRFRTNNVNRMSISNGGKVGIGLNTPVWKLDVKGGSINTDSLYRIGGTTVLSVKGTENTFIGKTGNTSNTGSGNTAAGFQALNSNTTGYYNTATGMYALAANTTGWQNTATGRMALSANTTGYWNTATGMTSLYANTTGNKNTATGQSALQSNTTASENTAIGASALAVQSYNPGSAWVSANTAVGYEALYSNQPTSASNGIYNTAVGYSVLRSNTTGYDNTANGTVALYSNTTGYYNTAIGRSALYYNTTGYYNTAIGHSALINNTAGNVNTAIGVQALFDNTTGGDNTAIGGLALANNTIGNNNTATGYQALYSSTGAHNTAIGTSALHYNSTGNYNTACGMYALYFNAGGNYNTAVGRDAGNNNGTAPANFTALGYNAGHVGSGTNTIEIGNTSVTWISGQVGWSLHSDRRIKDNIQSNVPGLSFITKLNPVTYNLNIHRQNEMCGINDTNEWEGKYDIEKIVQTGFIAQEVEQAAKECNYDFNGVRAPKGNSKLYSVSYSSFVMPLVKAVQELNEDLQVKNSKLETLNAELKSEIEMIKSVLSAEQQQKLKGVTDEKSTSGGSEGLLFQNSPNPFTEKSVIKYNIPPASHQAVIKIYTADGKELNTYSISSKGAGQIEISGNTLAAGIYNYTLFIDGKATDSKQMILTK